MKRTSVILGVILIAAVGVGFALDERSTSVPPVVAEVPLAAVGVDEYMRHPEAHPGRVRVQGVVSTVQADGKLVTLIDRHEFDKCGVVSCAALSLPVRWAGAMPQIKAVVEVTGQTQEEAGKFLFVADAMTPVPPVPAGAK